MKDKIIGIMPLADFKERTIAIAQGKYEPSQNEPKVWFSSIEALDHALAEENQVLIKTIMEEN